MSALTAIVAITGILAAGIIYGTDTFCALVKRPALTTLDDATLIAVMGRIHQYGDRRLPVPGIIGILAAAVDHHVGDHRRICTWRLRRRRRPRLHARMALPLPPRRRADQPSPRHRRRGASDARQRPPSPIAMGQHHHRTGRTGALAPELTPSPAIADIPRTAFGGCGGPLSDDSQGTAWSRWSTARQTVV